MSSLNVKELDATFYIFRDVDMIRCTYSKVLAFEKCMKLYEFNKKILHLS